MVGGLPDQLRTITACPAILRIPLALAMDQPESSFEHLASFVELLQIPLEQALGAPPRQTMAA
jgi:hypothetical protein